MKGYHYCKWLIANPYCQENMLKWKWKVKVIIIFLHYSNVKIRKSSDFVLLVWYLKQVDTKIQKVNSQKLEFKPRVKTQLYDDTIGTTTYCILANLCLFLFSYFRKGRLLYIHPVGRSVGRLVDVTISFFQYIKA